MNDWLAGTLIAASWVLLALGVAYGKDVAEALWTMGKQHKASPDYATLNAWPSTILPCESWIGREIEEATPWHIAEAEYVAAMAWDRLEMSPVREEGDDE